MLIVSVRVCGSSRASMIPVTTLSSRSGTRLQRSSRNELLHLLLRFVRICKYISHLITHMCSKMPRLDYLVNDSGAGSMAPLMDVDIAEAKNMFDVNVFALVT